MNNADQLIASSEAVVDVPGSAHIAYHLAVLSLEEIGKAILLFQESLEPKPVPRHLDEEPRSPMDWLEDHERKLFWAIWLTTTGPLDWRTIPVCLDFAKRIHRKRLHSLYFHPKFPEAQQKITADDVRELLQLAKLRLEIERAKKYRELSEDDKADMQWFFAASRDPLLQTWIYSKESIEKQAELAGEPNGWIRWLRGLADESARAAAELRKLEMERVAPEGVERYEDKWIFKIRLKSWSHSIRANQLPKWNEGNFVSHTVSAPGTRLDAVLQMAQRAHTPVTVESVPDRLADDKLIRGQVIFEALGNALDNMAQNYPGMYWWLTERGINMAITEPLHIRLGRRLENEVGTLPPQQRGYAFEKFLDMLFAVSGLSPRKSFRLIGEQIDGSFQLDHTTYLVEAKWQGELTGNRDLQAFAGIVGSKATWARGLFISYSGFSADGLYAFERGSKSIICLSGDELRYIFLHDLSLASVLLLKARHAAETGQVFVPIQELIERSS